MAGIEFNRLSKLSHRFRQLVLQFEGQSEVVTDSRIPRGNLDRAFEFGDSRVEVRHLQMRCPQIADVSAIVGPQTDCRLELRNGSAAVAGLQESKPQIVVRVRILWMQFHGPAKCLDRLFRLAAVLE